MNIEKILIIIIIIYLIIKKNKETFAMTDQISQAIKEVYNTDMESIRKLSDMAISLQNGGLTIPGNLTVTGNLNTNGNLTSTNINLSGTLTAPNITANTNLTANSIFNYLPKGTIVAFNSATPPAGWTLCDGNNGTPDLRGRFILGAGQGTNLTNRKITTTGGAETHTLTIDQMPQHSHSAGGGSNSWLGANTDGRGWHNLPNKGNGGKTWTYFASGTANTGGNQPHNIMPPYYVLTFIMKL